MKVYIHKQDCHIAVTLPQPYINPMAIISGQAPPCGAVMQGRMAILSCPYGQAMAVQYSDWNEPVTIMRAGWPMSDKYIRDILDECHEAGVEFEDFQPDTKICVHRPTPPWHELPHNQPHDDVGNDNIPVDLD